MRGVVGELGKLRPDDVTILDTEASIEHMTRGTVRTSDAVLLVTEPYFRSLETTGRLAPLARELGIPHIWAVANKVRTAAATRPPSASTATRHGIELLAVVPFDPRVTEADNAGLAVLDHAPDGPAVAAIAGARAVAGAAPDEPSRHAANGTEATDDRHAASRPDGAAGRARSTFRRLPTGRRGNVAGISQEEWVDLVSAETGPASITGPFEKVHVFWLAGMSCDGCSIAVLGATAPKVEDLLVGQPAGPAGPLAAPHRAAARGRRCLRRPDAPGRGGHPQRAVRRRLRGLDRRRALAAQTGRLLVGDRRGARPGQPAS